MAYRDFNHYKYSSLDKNDTTKKNDSEIQKILWKVPLFCFVFLMIILFRYKLSILETNVESKNSMLTNEEIAKIKKNMNANSIKNENKTNLNRITTSTENYSIHNFTSSTFRHTTDVYHSSSSSSSLSSITFAKTTTTTTTTARSIDSSTTKVAPTEDMHKEYYIFTSQCHMPRIDPFTKEAMEVFTKEVAPKCADYPELVTKSFDAKLGRYKLHIKDNKEKTIHCCYSEVQRAKARHNRERSIKLTDCRQISDEFLVPDHIEAILVNCNSTVNGTQTFAGQEAFSFAQKHFAPENSTSADKQKIVNKPKKRKPSVILVGVDSLSRFHFRRSMPETFKYLNSHQEWIELQGYNKVGDNTLPNLMPLLVGYNESLAFSKCHLHDSGGADNCDFIWKKFKTDGYITAYAEDTSTISTFNYIKPGFIKPPTDYYFRPLAIAMEDNMKVKEVLSLPYCIGRRQYAEYIYDYAIDILERHRNDSLFALFWANSFTHNYFKTSATFDDKMRKYLEEFERRNFLNESIFVFFSDHGCRWGPLMSLSSGFLEERLPMFFISLPKWYKTEYPEFEKALKVNAHRLVTPYDIYATLQNILKLNGFDENSLKPAESCNTYQSIFREMPENRTCEDACIPEHWCACQPFFKISTSDKVVRNVTQLLVDSMNDYLDKKMNLSSKCETLQLKSIQSALIKRETAQPQNLEEKAFRISFQTKPSNAKFQATVDYNSRTNKIRVEIPDISRLNTYRDDSKCIEHKISKKFCICRDSIK